MQNLIIIGNSGAAIECHALFNANLLANPTLRFAFNFKGFLAHNDYPAKLSSLSHLQIGSDHTYKIQSNDIFVIGIAKPSIRKDVYLHLKQQGATFLNLISPWAYIEVGTILGEANIIQTGSYISAECTIGNANFLNGTCLGHHACMGDYNLWGPDARAMGYAIIGSGNQIATRVILLEKSKIGNNNIITPMSCVYKGCKDNDMLGGNPALTLM